MLFHIINQLKAEEKSIVYISHKLDELFALADDFVVLRDGEVVGKGAMNQVTRNELIGMTAGREIKVAKKPIINRMTVCITSSSKNNAAKKV